jgi:hypothetical protein
MFTGVMGTKKATYFFNRWLVMNVIKVVDWMEMPSKKLLIYLNKK